MVFLQYIKINEELTVGFDPIIIFSIPKGINSLDIDTGAHKSPKCGFIIHNFLQISQDP